MTDDHETVLQRRIRKRLKELGYTAIGAARKAGLKRDAIRSILRKDGTKSPRGATLVAIAHVLEVPLQYLADTSTQGVAEGPAALDIPMRTVPLLSMERLAWHTPGKPLISERSITIPDPRTNLAAFRLVGTALERVAAEGCTCVVDLDDTEPRDGGIYVFRLNTVPGVRVYRDSDGPPRLEAESFSRHPVLYVSADDDFRVVGRVDFFITKAPLPAYAED